MIERYLIGLLVLAALIMFGIFGETTWCFAPGMLAVALACWTFIAERPIKSINNITRDDGTRWKVVKDVKYTDDRE